MNRTKAFYSDIIAKAGDLIYDRPVDHYKDVIV